MQLEQDIWQQLLRASVDKHHEWRCPALITNGLINEQNQPDELQHPEARTVILRSADAGLKQLTFYTDSRSHKVVQIAANPHATLVFWSKRLSQQLRVKVNICVDIDSELAKKTWQRVKQSPSAGDYLSIKAPGEKIDNHLDATAITANQLQSTISNFALLIATVVHIDWLALNRNGHQRAQIDENGVTYLVP